MVSVRATLQPPTSTPSGSPTYSPLSWPTWRSPHIHHLSRIASPFGHQAVWTSSSVVQRILCTGIHAEQSCPPVLAFFPPHGAKQPQSLSQLARLKATAPAPYLCAAANGVIFMSAPLSDELQAALHGFPTISRLFPLLSGLLVETLEYNHSRSYVYLPRVLDEASPVKFPLAGQIVAYASTDLPLLVTYDEQTVTFWQVHEKEQPIQAIAQPRENRPDQISSTIAQFIQTAHLETSHAQHVNERVQMQAQPLRRVLHLHKLYSTPNYSRTTPLVFLAHDLRAQMVICLHMAQEIHGFSFSLVDMALRHVAPSFRIRDVASAGAVLAVRRQQGCLDILVRHASGDMSLFMGRNRLCTVNVERPFQDAQMQHANVVDAVGDQFGLCDSTGRVCRYSLRATAFTSPLVNACLNAVSFALEANGVMLRMTTLYQNILSLRSQGLGLREGVRVDDCEWVVFADAVLKSSAFGGANGRFYLEDAMDTEDADASPWRPQDGEESWQALLNSECHRKKRHSRRLGPIVKPVFEGASNAEALDPNTVDVDVLLHILHALHLVYEDQKLCPISQKAASLLRALNVQVAQALGAVNYVDHYRRDSRDSETFSFKEPYSNSTPGLKPVPAITNYLADLIKDESDKDNEFPVLHPDDLQQSQCVELMGLWRGRSPADCSRKVVRYFQCIYGSEQRNGPLQDRAEKVLMAMVDDDFRRGDLEALPFGVALPLQDALLLCRQNPKRFWPYKAFALIEREDLFQCHGLDNEKVFPSKPELERIMEDQALLKIEAKAASLGPEGNMSMTSGRVNYDKAGAESRTRSTKEDGSDGCDMDGMVFQLRFSSDRRSDEVRRILRSTDPVVMTPPLAPREGGGDFDFAAEQKIKLDVLVRKRFASPVGRGAYTLRTFVPSDPTKPLVIPKICTDGMMFAQKGGKVTHSPQDATLLQWGEFHNGVAAGLRITAAEEDKESESGQILTRSWIVNHRPNGAIGSANHAGMLLALGLNGYLPALRATDYYEYLVPRHDLTSIGLMLGLASGNIGSMDDKVTKMLCVHIRHFNSPGFAVPDFHVPVNVQTAAILGLGLLHLGSCEHLIIDGLLSELGRRPRPGDNVDDRESLALAAGLSIGLVCLGSGSSAFDAADRSLIDRLVHYGNGGPGEIVDQVSGKLKSLSMKNMNGHERSNPASADSEASRIKEGDFINTDVVSPGALLALALIYLKSNEKHIAERILVPNSLYGLDRSRPDHVFLRILSRSLILWDEIEGSDEWILSTLPRLLKPQKSADDSGTYDLYGNVKMSGLYRDEDVDVNGIIQARAFGVAGACTAVALRFAGTSNPEIMQSLRRFCESFEKAIFQQEKEKVQVSWVFMTCLSSAALALSIVAAGSGDLNTLRLLRRLRKRRSKRWLDGRYGYHLALHLAIGFLFLGGGCQTFGTSNIAIASLVCAIYPRFPADIPDNQCHLQALRHLYVLAIEPRCIEARDVDTGEPCCVDLEVSLKNGGCLKRRAPCILPEAAEVDEVSVVSERYWTTKTEINCAIPGKGWYSNTKRQVLFVKRRTGHLPYSVDPNGAKSIMARSPLSLPSSDGSASAYYSRVDHLVKAFSADADVLAFVEYFCNSDVGSNANKASELVDRSAEYAEMLYECISYDKPEAVRAYIGAESTSRAVLAGHWNSAAVGSLIIADAYVQCGPVFGESLLKPTYLRKLIRQVHERLDSSVTRNALLNYIRSGGKAWPTEKSPMHQSLSDFCALLQFKGIPSPGQLSSLSSAMSRMTLSEETHSDIWLSLVSHGKGAVIAGLEGVLDSVEKETYL